MIRYLLLFSGIFISGCNQNSFETMPPLDGPVSPAQIGTQNENAVDYWLPNESELISITCLPKTMEIMITSSGHSQQEIMNVMTNNSTQWKILIKTSNGLESRTLSGERWNFPKIKISSEAPILQPIFEPDQYFVLRINEKHNFRFISSASTAKQLSKCKN